MNSISLQTENLVIGYTKGKESTLVLEDINVSCGQSELICLMGGNGSGKSTLLRTLSGLQNPLSGDVFIEKKNIDAYDPIGLSRKLSITLPTGTVTGNMNVKELVALGRYPYLDWKINFTRQDNDIVNRALVMTNTEKIRDRMCHELSDGQLQKVFIARAIAQDTPLMILDEPANHLDLNNRLEMMRLLTVLAKDHEKSIIVSTHHLDLALQLADKLWVILPDGSLISGVPEDLCLNGTIERAFPAKNYDIMTGKVQYEPTGKQVYLEEKEKIIWVKQALERKGFITCDEKKAEVPIISPAMRSGKLHIEITRGESVEVTDTIEEMLRLLISGH